MVPLAYYNGMEPRYWDWRFRLRGMPDINQRGSEGMGISNPRRVTCDPRTLGRPSRGAKAVVSCASKNKRRLRAKSEAICSRWEEQGAKRQSDGAAPRICSMEPYQITNALNQSESTYNGNLMMVSDRAK